MQRMLTLITSIFVITGLLFGVFVTSADAYVSVRGYYRRDGTYVQPHVRSSPNAFRFDNYGYSGGSRYSRSYSYPTRNYSSDWYAPSYLTDPDYYRGRSLYNSRSYDFYSPSYYRSRSYNYSSSYWDW